MWVSGTELTFIFSTYVLVTEPVTVFVPPSISTFLTHWSDCGSNLISPKNDVIWNGFIIIPLSIPAFASIFILQFLWCWNDLLVGLVFLDQVPSEIILTAKLKELLGSRGENWEILTTGAFVSMTVPLFIFFALQRYFIRGLVAGSVKG